MWSDGDESEIQGYMERDTRCWHCGDDDISVVAADGRVWCSKTCRELTRVIDEAERKRISERMTQIEQWRADHADDEGQV